MRTILSAALVLGLAAGPLAAADDAARAVLDRAVQAHGGADALKRARTARRTASGAFAALGKDVPFTEEAVWQLPGRLRLSVEVGGGPDRSRIVLVLGTDKGWQSTGGAVTELGPERLAELREEAYVLWLTTLTPLRDGGFELTALPESRVGDRPAAGVRAASKGHPDVQLYFDKETGLLVRVERRAREAGLTFDKAYDYADPKDFDGVKLSTRVTELHNGKRFADLRNVSYKLLRTANDADFTRP